MSLESLRFERQCRDLKLSSDYNEMQWLFYWVFIISLQYFRFAFCLSIASPEIINVFIACVCVWVYKREGERERDNRRLYEITLRLRLSVSVCEWIFIFLLYRTILPHTNTPTNFTFTCMCGVRTITIIITVKICDVLWANKRCYEASARETENAWSTADFRFECERIMLCALVRLRLPHSTLALRLCLFLHCCG